MKIVKLHYFDTYEIFQGNRRFTKLGLEAEIDEDYDNVRDCFYKLKRQSEELFYESKVAAEKQMGTHVVDEQKPSLTKVADLIKEINFCKDIGTLEKTYKYIAKTDEDVQEAYYKKYSELSKIKKHD